jgi:hypothetical protein
MPTDSRSPQKSAELPSARAAFELRCEARAYLVAAGEYTLHEAVDQLQADAERSGLVAELGQDAIQRIMSEAFAAVSGEIPDQPEPPGGDPWNSPSWREAALDYHKERGDAC